jgi:hypothetical protein
MTGANQNFFRCFMKFHKSFSVSIYISLFFLATHRSDAERLERD